MSNEDIEEYAFYESGLSAHGCLEKLDQYTLDAITEYGRIIQRMHLEKIKSGFQGCCYACEVVGITNQELEAKIKKMEDSIEKLGQTIQIIDELIKLYKKDGNQTS
jgi:hypothetical protein